MRRPLTHTRTFATMEVRQETFDEIAEKLKLAAYHHAFLDHDTCLDMNGIALRVERTAPEPDDADS